MQRPPTELSVKEFAEKRGESDTLTLLDVRELWEIATAAVGGSVNIPMGQISSRLAELDPEAPIVVMCHSGMRSSQVAQYLMDQGFSDVYNLTGGIDAWSQEIDPTVPRY